MRLTRLALQEFRSYRSLDLSVPEVGFRLHGLNASGKTTLLEAIYLLATTRSPRASFDRDMINWESNAEYGLAPFARAAATLLIDGEQHEIEAVITADPGATSTARKRVKLDGRARRAVDVVGTLKVVLFSPEDLDLVLGSPATRRRYLDITISQLDRLYLQSLNQYNRLLEQRNSLLKDLGATPSRSADQELAYWDEELTTRASYLLAARISYLAGLAEAAAAEFTALSGIDVKIDLAYQSTVPMSEALRARVASMSPLQGQTITRRAFESALASQRAAELRRGVTLVGPHRDDLLFQIDGRGLASFGSRGQQRLAVVATKLAELDQVLRLSGDQPILLLDDVLSELDPVHRGRLLKAVGRARCQVVVTATDRQLLSEAALSDLPELEVRDGQLFAISPAGHAGDDGEDVAV